MPTDVPRNTAATPDRAERRAALSLLWGETAPERARLRTAALWLALAAGLEALGPVLGKAFIDRHLLPQQGPLVTIAALLGGAFVAGWLAQGLRYVQLVGLAGVAMRTVQRLRERVYAHVLSLPLAFFDRAITGALVSRVTNDTEAIKSLYVQVLFVMLDSVIVLAGLLVTMAWLDWRLVGIVALLVPAVVGIVTLYTRWSAPAVARTRALRSELNAQFAEGVAGMAVIQAAGADGAFAARHARTNDEHLASRRAELRANAWLLRPALDFLNVALLAAVIGTVGWSRVDAFEVGVLYAFVSYIARVVEPLIQITMQFSQLQQAVVAAARVNALLDEAPAPQPQGPSRVTRGAIAIEHLDFAYISGTPVLHDVSLSIEPGQFIGIVGHTGSGKSTLLALLLRFYALREDQARAITIDGQPLAKLDDADFRRQVGLVPQDPFLLAASVRENIALGRALSDAQIEAAARAAHAHDFITRLEQGYDTPLGEGGARLAVGEKQLIAIARALAGEPRILLLDEATAHIDTATEREVQAALAALRGRVTVIAIAHRLATIRDADRIVVMHHGRVAEQGDHAALMAIDGGLYQRLVQLHQLSLADDDDAVNDDTPA